MSGPSWLALSVFGLCFFMLAALAGTFLLSVYNGRFTLNAGSSGEVHLFPWITDTWQFDPEKGLAVATLGPSFLALIFLAYVWHARCNYAARLSDSRVREVLRLSPYVLGLVFLTAVTLLALLGFQASELSGQSVKHLIRGLGIAAGFFLSCAISLITYIEFNAGLSLLYVHAARALICVFCVLSMVAAEAVTWIMDCPDSHIVQVSTRDQSSCLVQSLRPECVETVAQADAWCQVAPACAFSAFVGVLGFVCTLGWSFWGVNFQLSIWDDKFREGDLQRHDEGPGRRNSGQGGQCLEPSMVNTRNQGPAHVRGESNFEGLKPGAKTDIAGIHVKIEENGHAMPQLQANQTPQVMKAMFARTADLRGTELISAEIIQTIEGVFTCFEADDEAPNIELLAERVQKLFVSFSASQKSKKKLSSRHKSTKPEHKNGDSTPQHKSHSRQIPNDPSEDEMDPQEEQEPPDSANRKVDQKDALSVVKQRFRGTDRWKEQSVPGLQDLSEFDPVTPAVTEEQRKRLVSAKKALIQKKAAAGRPKTPQQAWEAHMQMMGASGAGGMATDGSNNAVLPPGDANGGAAAGPKPMLAAKLAKDVV